ncbi:hypothetical protein DRW03_22455 [Corallococcus sp. H22C18031201]|nr:hypothetical protein DRW03_22455 [Corallococcus sp. H22C18031201]
MPRLMGMVRDLVPEAFWQRVAPLLPPPLPKKKLGRPRADDRSALEAIVFVLRSSRVNVWLIAHRPCRPAGCRRTRQGAGRRRRTAPRQPPARGGHGQGRRPVRCRCCP